MALPFKEVYRNATDIVADIDVKDSEMPGSVKEFLSMYMDKLTKFDQMENPYDLLDPFLTLTFQRHIHIADMNRMLKLDKSVILELNHGNANSQNDELSWLDYWLSALVLCTTVLCNRGPLVRSPVLKGFLCGAIAVLPLATVGSNTVLCTIVLCTVNDALQWDLNSI
uniref:Uncharacterized protein n=1 Tax=Romanomermis culicivorax TaxID=13658 RepID=A0A915KDM4_ROMCU